MKRFSDAALATAVWTTLAVAATVVAGYEGVLLLVRQPAPLSVQWTFGGCGFLAVLAWRRETLLRGAWRTDRRAFGRACIRVLAGAFGLAMIAAFVYPLFATARSGSQHSPQTNLKIIALAMTQYAQDHDGYLPPPGANAEHRTALRPYLHNDYVWTYLKKGDFMMNRFIAGHALAEFPQTPDGKSKTVLLFSDWVTVSDRHIYRYVAFTDGDVRRVSEDDFHRGIRSSLLQTAKHPLPSPPK